MTVNVTLRYPSKTPVRFRTTEEIREGCTAGELCSSVIKAYEKQEEMGFTSANIAIIANGRLVTTDTVLKNGDDIMIIPVASGG